MPPPDPSQLLADSKWMRSLAGSLIYGDRSVIDDLVQETWLAAVKQRTVPTRAWARAVMRNLVRLRFRSQARRREREELSHEPRDVPTPEELSTRMELQQKLAEAVLRLREPYREAVLLRFNEDMQPQEIAEHLGIAPGTVRSRLKRGLDLLRDDFDSRHGGDGRAWALALLPLSDRGSGVAVAGMLSPHRAAWVVAAGVAASLALLAIGLGRNGARDSQAELAVDLPVGDETKQRLSESPLGQAESQRAAVPTHGVVSTVNAARYQTIRGIAFDSLGSPLGGVGISFANDRHTTASHASPVGRTERNGTFEVRVPRSSGVLRVDDPNWTSLFDSTLWGEMTSREAILVGAPPVSVSLQVHDELGAAISATSVRYLLPENYRRDFGRRLATANRFQGTVQSDSHGRVRWETLPWVAGAQLLISAPGFSAVRLTVDRTGLRDVPVQLDRLAPGSRDVAGWAFDESGQGVSNAWVCIGRRTVRTADDGAFRFTDLESEIGTRIFCSALGLTVTSMRLEEEHFAQDVIVRLGEATQSISGVVLDRTRAPQPGVRLWLADPTFVGRDPESGAPLYSESLAVPGEPFPWQGVVTDETGRFQLDGLNARPYSLIALGASGVGYEVSGPWPAGAKDVELVLDVAPAGVFVGVAHDALGRPLQGVSMWLERTVLEFPYDSEDRVEHPNTEESVRVQSPVDGRIVVMEEQASTLRRVVGELVHTDELGRFELAHYSDAGEWFLRAWMPGRMQMEWPLDGVAIEGSPQGARKSEWVLPEERSFRVERLPGGLEFDSYSAWSAAGEQLCLLRSDGDILIFLLRGSFRGKQSAVYSISEFAETLVFERDGEEVARVPLGLIAGETVTVGL